MATFLLGTRCVDQEKFLTDPNGRKLVHYMPQHAEPGLHPTCLDLLVSWVLDPDPPALDRKHIPPVRDVYYQLQLYRNMFTNADTDINLRSE